MQLLRGGSHARWWLVACSAQLSARAERSKSWQLKLVALGCFVACWVSMGQHIF
jgi:hypothetical protein